LAYLLTDPLADSENVGDNLTISMIGDQPGVNPSNSILDASEAPSLIWQLEKGYLSNFESSDEPEYDSTESVESESDSGSSESESESGILGVDNPNAKVLSRSSFSFSFESVVIKEELDLT